MNQISKKLKAIESKYPIGIYGLIITIVLSAAAILISIYYQNNPELTYEIDNTYTIFYGNDDLNKIQIFYNDVNVDPKNDVLGLMAIKVKNYGKDILLNYYDDKDPLGFEIENVKIIQKPELIEGSSSYFKNNANIKVINDNTIAFNQIIINKGESFTIKLIVLSKKDKPINLKPKGKLAGQNTFNILYPDQKKGSIIERLFPGSTWDNIARLLVHFALFFIVIFIVMETLNLFKIVNLDSPKK